MRPLTLLILLCLLGAGLAHWLKQEPAVVEDGRRAPGEDFNALTQGTQIDPGSQDTQVRLLEGQVEYLQGQLKVLQEENEALIERLGTLGLDRNEAAKPVVPEDGGPDFVGLGIELTSLRELMALPIPTQPTSMDGLRDRILKRLRQWQPEDAGPRFGRALHALGWIPESLDPLPLQAALLTLQLGAWYDADDQTLWVLDPEEAKLIPGQRRRDILGTAWAQLQKEFGPTLLPDGGTELTTDERLARVSVLAGDAGLTRFLYELRNPVPNDPKELPSQDPDHPYNGVPLPQFLRDLHFFPTNEGFEFMQTLHSLGGFRQMGASYSRPPRTTAEILDAERYLDEVSPLVPQVSWNQRMVKGMAPLWDDRLGQFALLTALRMACDGEVAGKAAAGWLSDRLLVYPASGGGRDHAVWQTLWKTQDSAQAFFAAMEDFLRLQYSEQVDRDSSSDLSFQTEDREVTLRLNRQGSGVLLLDLARDGIAPALQQRFDDASGVGE